MIDALAVLTQAFKGLSDDARKNLKFHYDNTTELFCGERADERYVNEEGFV